MLYHVPYYKTTSSYIYMYTHTYTHTHTPTHIHRSEYYSVMGKNEILPFPTTWVKLEDIMLSEISQTKKEKYCISLICKI